MRAITDIGQAEIRVDGRSYFLCPSFLAMTRIGRPEDIVTALACVYGGQYPKHRIMNPDMQRAALAISYAKMLYTAARILNACSEEDLSEIIGVYEITTRGKLLMRPGLVPPEDVIVLARDLIRHGVLGDQENDEDVKGEYTPRFDARALVYLAVAHLGLNESDAWNMTMTSFRAAFAAKFPKPEKPKIPNGKDYDKAMAWADAVAKRDAVRKR